MGRTIPAPTLATVPHGPQVSKSISRRATVLTDDLLHVPQA